MIQQLHYQIHKLENTYIGVPKGIQDNVLCNIFCNGQNIKNKKQGGLADDCGYGGSQ